MNDYLKVTFLLFLFTLLTMPSANAESMKWNSTNYELQSFELSSAGGKWNSTSYEGVVNTHHYQQQVGTTFSITYQGVIRWLEGLLGAAPGAGDIIWEVQYCPTNSSVTYETISQVSGVNTTTDLVTEPCQYGCDEGRCIDIEQSVDYSMISIIFLIMALVTFIGIFLRTKSPIMKVMFMILIVIFLLIIIFIGFSPSTLTTNSIIQQVGGISLSMFQMFSIVITLLTFVVFTLWITNKVRVGKEIEFGLNEEDEEDDLL